MVQPTIPSSVSEIINAVRLDMCDSPFFLILLVHGFTHCIVDRSDF